MFSKNRYCDVHDDVRGSQHRQHTFFGLRRQDLFNRLKDLQNAASEQLRVSEHLQREKEDPTERIAEMQNENDALQDVRDCLLCGVCDEVHL